MTIQIRCGDPAALAGYVYDDCDPAERDAMTVHLVTCAACAEEIATLRMTREHLGAWTTPETRLGFRVVAEDAVADVPTEPELAALHPDGRGLLRPERERSARSWWQWSAVPAWAQAAAAVLLFACGAGAAALMNLEVRYDQSGLTLRTGWQQAAVQAPAPVATPAVTADTALLDTRIRDAIRRIRAEEDGGKGLVGAPSEPSAGTHTALVTSNDLMRRVREMLAASEERQQRELALRVSQVIRDVDSQRRADIARIERTVAPMQGVTTEEIQQQRRMLNYLTTVSQTK